MKENFKSKTFDKADKFFLVYSSLFVVLVVLTNVIGAKLFETPFSIQYYLFGTSESSPYFDTLTTGIITYPLTFLMTDVLSEIWGSRKTSFVVIIGFALSIVMMVIVKTAVALPPSQIWVGSINSTQPEEFKFLTNENVEIEVPIDSVQNKINVDQSNKLNTTNTSSISAEAQVVALKESGKVKITIPGSQSAFASVFAMGYWLLIGSMCAYLVAQLIDVKLFHFFKNLTKGKHLWLRNNGSTMGSQLIDTLIVNSFLFYGAYNMGFWMGLQIMIVIYLYKMAIAWIDTPLIYLLVNYTKKELGLTDDDIADI